MFFNFKAIDVGEDCFDLAWNVLLFKSGSWGLSSIWENHQLLWIEFSSLLGSGETWPDATLLCLTYLLCSLAFPFVPLCCIADLLILPSSLFIFCGAVTVPQVWDFSLFYLVIIWLFQMSVLIFDTLFLTLPFLWLQCVNSHLKFFSKDHVCFCCPSLGVAHFMCVTNARLGWDWLCINQG